MNELYTMYLKLIAMGATEEDIKAIYKIALETTDKIVKEGKQ